MKDSWGPTNSAWPSLRCLKNCQMPKWQFLTPACNLKTVWVTLLHLKWYESATVWKNMSPTLSSSIKVLLWEEKLDYLNNPSQDFKNYFCLGFLRIPSNAMLEDKIRVTPFFKVQSSKITVCMASTFFYKAYLDSYVLTYLTKFLRTSLKNSFNFRILVLWPTVEKIP